MIQKLINNNAPAYEILDYIITPSSSEVNTEVLVNGTTVVDMTCTLRQRSWQAPRFFSSNDTNTDVPGWNQAGTWGLQFEDSGSNLSIKMLGADYSRLSDAVIVRTGITYNDLSNKKLRYNLTAAGILTIFNTDDTVFRSYDATAETDTSVTSSTPIKLFHRFASHEYINNGTYVYDVKIWDNDVLIRHYLPVKRLSDNVYGLYDIINNTFHSNEVSGYSFSGTSKSTPEYIYNKMLNYVNDIVINGTHINRIYNDGEIYWGNEKASISPVQHLLHGTTTLTGSGTFNIGINNTMYNSQKNVTVQYDNGEFWLDELPSSIGTIKKLVGMFWGLKHVTSIDEFNLDTSQCVDWRTAFGGASITTFGTISPDLTSCTSLHDCMHEFAGETLDLSRWHVTSKVTDINGIFYNSPNLKHIDVSNWQLSQLLPRDFWFNMKMNQIIDVTMNNVSEGTFATFKYALSFNYPTQTTAKIYRDGVTYVYKRSQWVTEQ